MAVVVFDWSEVQHRLGNAFRSMNGSALLFRAGEEVLDAAYQSFRAQADPVTGAPWAPLARGTVAGRRKGGAGAQILLDRGILRGSLVRSGTLNVWRAKGNTSLTVGTAVAYGAVHQFGGRGYYVIVPRRARLLRFRVDKGKKGIRFAKKVNHPPLKARPFLGVSPALSQKIADDLNRTFSSALAGR